MKLYQNIKIPNCDYIYEDVRRKHSKFWNEGKWNNFIKPLLKKYSKDQVFIELGCCTGLMLKMAENRGFGRVVGVDKNKKFIETAEKYRESINGKYTLFNKKVGSNLNVYELPLANVILMSNFHYYLKITHFQRLINQLRSRCQRLIIVSAQARIIGNNARYDMDSVLGHFKNWERKKIISDIDATDDPSPRPTMFSVLYKGELETRIVKELWEIRSDYCRRSDKPWRNNLTNPVRDFFQKVLKDNDTDFINMYLYSYWQERRPDKPKEWILEKLKFRKKLADSIRLYGIREPIFIDKNNRIVDGFHRLTVARELGYKSVLVRVV